MMLKKGSPLTYITDKTIKQLLDGHGETTRNSLLINLHGTMMSVNRSNMPHHHFKDINLLGANFLEMTKLAFSADYYTFVAKIEKSKNFLLKKFYKII